MTVIAKTQGKWTYWIDVSDPAAGVKHSWAVTKVHQRTPETTLAVTDGVAETQEGAERAAHDARDTAMRTSYDSDGVWQGPASVRYRRS